MRLAFIGAVEFSARCLEALLADGAELEPILAQRTARSNADFRDLGGVAARHGRKVVYFDKATETLEALRAAKPDVLFVLGLSQILPLELLAIPRLGCIGSHPALLPKNRGRHPIVWTLANGLPKAGLTLFWLDEGVDSGDIWKQSEFPVAPEDDAGSVYDKVGAAACRMLSEGLRELKAGTVKRVKQDASLANYWRKRGPKDGEIDWRMSSRRIVDLVRALRSPYPGAHCAHQGAEVKVWKAAARAAGGFENIEPGKVVGSGVSGPLVKTGDGVVELVEHGFTQAPAVGEYIG